MNSSFQNAISKYLFQLKNSSWVVDESYKFEFANYLQSNISWANQSDEDILKVLINSQKIKYTGGSKGIQFILKSGREEMSNFISLTDVKIFREVISKDITEVDFSKRTMSFTGLSAWLGALFPQKFYPLPQKGFNNSIYYLFGTPQNPIPKVGIKYIFECQSYFNETEKLLRQYPIEEFYISEWNKFSKENSSLNIPEKIELSDVDWAWITHDFHFFIFWHILKLSNKKNKNIIVQNSDEPSVIEGNSKLARHMRYERNSGFITRIKKEVIAKNRMLTCEVCGFSFLAIYGDMGAGFIEAHHKNPLHNSDGPTETKKEDIALVCSNCHRMLHRGNPIVTVEELKSKLVVK